jgi:hypothetical protein
MSINFSSWYTDTSMSDYNLNFKQKQYQNQPAKTVFLGYPHQGKMTIRKLIIPVLYSIHTTHDKKNIQ